MSYLLRVALPDVPGSLGRLASAIGSAGGNIDAIEIVERSEGRAVDDVFLAPEPGVMPDSIVSACTSLPDVEVLWISRYGAGFEPHPGPRGRRGDDLGPGGRPRHPGRPAARDLRRRLGGARAPGGRRGQGAARDPAAPTEVPEDISWPLDLQRGRRIEVPERLSEMLLAGCSLNDDEMVVIARRGGPEILDSEIARLCHLVALAASISS